MICPHCYSGLDAEEFNDLTIAKCPNCSYSDVIDDEFLDDHQFDEAARDYLDLDY